MKIRYENKSLYIENQEISFKDNIFQIKIDDDKIYVLLDIPSKRELVYDDFHNVYCYSTKGEKKWQIGVKPKGDEAVYTMIGIDNDFLYANDFMGRRYTVEKRTGNIIGMVVTK
ncbi:MAG: hypothetical protein RRX92_02935 [Lachnospiraceae bacterium]